MISALTGEVRRVEEGRVHLVVGSIVFEVLVPANDSPQLQSRLGSEVTLHTILDLEGDPSRGGLTPRLIGFLRPDDKRFFELFITVKGIGPKRALRALTAPTSEIAAAIENKNTRFLIGLPEVGKRTAEQIVAELAGKAGKFVTGPAMAKDSIARAVDNVDEAAIATCMVLGLARAEAERLLDRARQSNPTLTSPESLSREMLRLRAVGS